MDGHLVLFFFCTISFCCFHVSQQSPVPKQKQERVHGTNILKPEEIKRLIQDHAILNSRSFPYTLPMKKDANKKIAKAGFHKRQGGMQDYQGGMQDYQGGMQDYQDGLHDYQGGMQDYQGGIHDYQGGMQDHQSGLHDFQGGMQDIQQVPHDYFQSGLQDSQSELHDSQGGLQDERISFGQPGPQDFFDLKKRTLREIKKGRFFFRPRWYQTNYQ